MITGIEELRRQDEFGEDVYVKKLQNSDKILLELSSPNNPSYKPGKLRKNTAYNLTDGRINEIASICSEVNEGLDQVKQTLQQQDPDLYDKLFVKHRFSFKDVIKFIWFVVKLGWGHKAGIAVASTLLGVSALIGYFWVPIKLMFILGSFRFLS